jgi:Tfp pilus assembly protein PilF
MSSLRPKDRLSLCTFTFSDNRQCRTPRAPNHPHLCHHHARKQSQADSANQLADELAFFFSGQYLSANDLSAALGRLFPAVVRGDIKPRAARTLAYLAQTMLQSIHLAQHEYINALGTPE